MPKTIKLTVCTEGMTLNGFAVTREQIQQMADSYNPRLYAARLNLEHVKSLFPDSTFRQFALVQSASAYEVKDGPLQGKLALEATVELDEEKDAELIKLNQSGQKIFSSIEFYSRFPQTQSAYLTGIALTDTPAAVGTELIKLSVQERGLPASDDRYLSASLETMVELLAGTEQNPVDDKSLGEKFVLSVKKALGLHRDHNNAELNILREMVQLTAEKCGEALNQAQKLCQLETLCASQSEKITVLENELSTLKSQLSKQDNSSTHRPLANGSTQVLADY
ncbi:MULTISPECIES: GPO family capsid scaffolding protein [unclassified Photorhabdus]|uniref:GPO family capsid scaffolding protein n=2 Tax=Photorhabdus TaxID=29487 RepID=UPI000DCC1014|nr:MULTISPECIES: GPO family capsid scaffolding protein [unclassified Photorhabdus]RAX00762.1 phage capsid protein [Photorhabdus sp. S9-53]RAX00965.1 phage capsid protein [Photorhabdus sp. S10-54]RAX05304.1 phage capsid protein [Photorhabdus sp. S8-52]